MSQHSELLKQARFITRKELKRPTQASLRRSVSTSRYALFHLLVDEATKLLLSGPARAPLRDGMAGAYHHFLKKDNVVAFTKNPISPKLSSGFDQEPVPQTLVDAAIACPTAGSPSRRGLQSRNSLHVGRGTRSCRNYGSGVPGLGAMAMRPASGYNSDQPAHHWAHEGLDSILLLSGTVPSSKSRLLGFGNLLT